jgi:4-diphosphocytidyl-2-C-methyl-D-erythritol kinase
MPLLQMIAPFKINLNLHVIGLNDAGYHLLEGVSVFANDGDNIDIDINDKNFDSLVIKGQFSDFLNTQEQDNNLIIKAIKLLRTYKNFPFISVTLGKNIPIQAGYGGGSSDAATILKNINQLFHLDIAFDDLMKIGQSLGADVPMCLYGKPCFIQNIGDKITPLTFQNKTYFCLLLKPDFMMSTIQVFTALKNKNNPAMPNINITDNLMDYAITHGRNDLWQPACNIYPELEHYLHALKRTNPIKAAMSGSGSGLFALYKTYNDLNKAYDVIIKKFNNNFVLKTTVNI